MSLTSTTSRVSYTGNGAVDTYSYTFPIFSDSDLRVTVRSNATPPVETTLTLTTDYTVTGAGEPSGGTVVLVNSGQSWLDADGDLKTGYVIVIRRVRSLKQETDIRNQGEFYPESHEDEFDKEVMIDQQQQDEINRSVRLPETYTSSSFDPVLPTGVVGAASKCPTTNTDGTGWAAASTWPTATEISNAQTYANNASTSATNAATSATLSSDWASKTSAAVEGAEWSAKAHAIGGTGGPSAGNAKDWATKTTATVDGSDYSAKEWAKGTQTRGAASGGSAKDWANYTSGTVDNAEYSAKKYAQDAAASAASAASQLNSAFFRDVVYKTSADSPVTITSSDNGKLFVFDTSGGAISVTLPQMSGLTPPFNIAFLLKTAGNTLTVNRAGTDTIMGATSKALSAAGTGFQLAADTDAAPDDWSAMDFGSVADGAITNSKLAATAVTGHTAETSVATDDTLLIHDTSESALNKATVENIIAGAAASQAEQEAGSATNRVVTPGRQKFHQSAAKVWGSFDGTAGTPTIVSGSFNVSSITDGGVGIYTVNLTTNFSNGNYSVAVATNEPSAVSHFACVAGVAGSLSGSTIPLRGFRHDNTAADVNFMSFIAFGDQ